MASVSLSYELIKKQDAETSNVIIEYFSASESFQELARVEGDLILQRDQEDADKLQAGIDYAKSKGVIDPDYIPEPYVSIDVLGKTPDEVCDEILIMVQDSQKDSTTGTVIVLCGLSGTGKGTTVTKLRERLQQEYHRQVVCWSNGNIFRSLTLLAVTWCEQQQQPGCLEGLDQLSKALTPENIALFMSMLSFECMDGQTFDTKIHGLGLDMFVSQVQNTELKQPKVARNIPTVAEYTQGEVILFASKAIERMSNSGICILLEGREQTVNYVRTPLRFTLMLSDESLIGKRRAAQRLMAAVYHDVNENSTEVDMKNALEQHLVRMLAEIAN